jgi:hypothetical protein
MKMVARIEYKNAIKQMFRFKWNSSISARNEMLENIIVRKRALNDKAEGLDTPYPKTNERVVIVDIPVQIVPEKFLWIFDRKLKTSKVTATPSLNELIGMGKDPHDPVVEEAFVEFMETRD